MVHFKGSDKLAKLIHANQFLLPVINRFGIRLGFKERTVSQICDEFGIDENFFLTIVNTYNNEDYFPESDLLSFSPRLIIDYLRKTHSYYFNYLFPEVERRLERVLAGCEGSCDDLQLIKKFYNKYKEELSKHIEEEEDKVFPYILAIIDAWENKVPVPEKFKGYSMQSFEQEHTNVDQKIYDLKNIVIKYLNASYDDNDCNAFLYSIFQFEKDLLDHARIEDKILEVKVIELEKQLKNG
ncbi:MAG: hemerythrin domain-containing protein [Salinivirgaceae bacterium]|jgi:regulator of cell morphogenesis and NO signaling|nr:hemerythrin domain-containing protein [Salinivirgaceae bacterium]